MNSSLLLSFSLLNYQAFFFCPSINFFIFHVSPSAAHLKSRLLSVFFFFFPSLPPSFLCSFSALPSFSFNLYLLSFFFPSFFLVCLLSRSCIVSHSSDQSFSCFSRSNAQFQGFQVDRLSAAFSCRLSRAKQFLSNSFC